MTHFFLISFDMFFACFYKKLTSGNPITDIG